MRRTFLYVLQRIRKGDLQIQSILRFVFDVLEFFVSFKMTPHIYKLSKQSNFTILKDLNFLTICFILEFFHLCLRKAAATKGLSTRALKPDSLDPDSMWSCVNYTWHTKYVYCTAGSQPLPRLDTSSCSTATLIPIETVWRQSEKSCIKAFCIICILYRI